MPLTDRSPAPASLPHRFARWAIIGCASLVGVLWTASFYTELASQWLPLRREARFAVDLWEQAAAAMTEEQQHVARDLEALAFRLAQDWPDNPYGLRVAIQTTDAVRLQALPGGDLLISTALLEALQSEDELSFLLAHEIGHLRQREHLQVLGRLLVVVWAMDTVGVTPAVQGKLLEGFGILGRHVPSGPREEAADRFALQALAREYGHVAGALTALEQLSKLGAAPDHFVLTARQAMQRRTALVALTRTEGLKIGGEPRPMPGRR